MKTAKKTIQDWIQEIRVEAMSEISPHRASVLLTRLSALWGSVNDLYITAEMTYNQKFEELSNKYEKITEARAKAQVTPEYEEKLRAEGFVKVTEELIRAMKYVIKAKIAEYRESRQEG